jgi:deoxycytidylate deaminase
MPILSTGYASTGGSWRQQASSTQGNNRVSTQHAERQVLRDLSWRGANPVLIVQNAFPCHECHSHFLRESGISGTSIIVKVTKNEGQYSLDHGLSASASVPCIIYYHAGSSSMVGLWSRSNGDAPGGFPAHPDFADIE